MSTCALVDVDKQAPPKSQTTRASLRYIEVPPSDSWFQQTVDYRGRPIWFFRLQVIGLRTRRYGPFASKRKALVFLDSILDDIGNALINARNDIGEYQIKEPALAYRGDHYPIVEDEIFNEMTSKEAVPLCEPLRALPGQKGR